jgi:hypothetical protein
MDRANSVKVVAYYTEGTVYEKLAERLVEKLSSMGIDYHVKGYPNTGTWLGNAKLRPEHLLWCIEEFGDRDFLSIDVDAQIMGGLDYFNEKPPEVDLMIYRHKFPNGSVEVMPGTLFFRNHWKTKALMFTWMAECGKWPAYNSGRVLRNILDGSSSFGMDKLTVEQMPQKFCNVEGEVVTEDAVILHTKASRNDSGLASTVTLVTPTGDRTDSFALCREMMSSQTVVPYQWIVVDDGKNPLPAELRRGVHYIRREPARSDPSHTLGANMQAALPFVRTEYVIIIEDDDWYHPQYVEKMLRLLGKAHLVGFGMAIYYNFEYRRAKFHRNLTHCSFANTAFNRRVIPYILRNCVGLAAHLDLHLWRHFSGSKRISPIDKDFPLTVGVKGVPGRRSRMAGWKREALPIVDDDKCNVARRLLPVKWFDKYTKLFDLRISSSLVVRGSVEFSALQLIVTMKCNLSCERCNMKQVMMSQEHKNYQMSMEELEVLLGYLKDSEVVRRQGVINLYLTGGDALCWENLQEGLERLEAVDFVGKVVLQTNAMNHLTIEDKMLEGKTVLKVSQYLRINDENTRKLLRRVRGLFPTTWREKIQVTRIRHDVLPECIDRDCLPAECYCRKPMFLKGQFHICYNTLNLEERLGLEIDPKTRCGMDEDYYDKFRDFQYNADICAGCWSNKKVYDRYYGGPRTL